MKKIINVSLKTILRDKITKLAIIIIAFTFFTGTIISIYQNGAEKNLYYNPRGKYVKRMIMVGKLEDMDLQEQKKELIQLDHILDVMPNYDIASMVFENNEFKTKNTDGKIKAFTASNSTIPKIEEGTNFPHNEGMYLICPQKMYANLSMFYYKQVSKITNKDRINTSDYIGKKLNYSFSAYDENGYPKTKNIDITIVGTYRVDDHLLYDNICYMNENLKKTAFNEKYIDRYKDKPLIEKEDEMNLVIIDDYNNLDKVIDEISKLNYGYSTMSTTDKSFLTELKKSTKAFCKTAITINLIIMFIFFTISLNRNKKRYKLYEFLGYSISQIQKINLITNLLITMLAFLVSIIISIFYKYILQIIIYYRPFIFNKYEIIFSIKYLFLIFIISFIMTIVISIINNIYLKYKLIKLNN